MAKWSIVSWIPVPEKLKSSNSLHLAVSSYCQYMPRYKSHWTPTRLPHCPGLPARLAGSLPGLTGLCPHFSLRSVLAEHLYRADASSSPPDPLSLIPKPWHPGPTQREGCWQQCFVNRRHQPPVLTSKYIVVIWSYQANMISETC